MYMLSTDGRTCYFEHGSAERIRTYDTGFVLYSRNSPARGLLDPGRGARRRRKGRAPFSVLICIIIRTHMRHIVALEREVGETFTPMSVRCPSNQSARENCPTHVDLRARSGDSSDILRRSHRVRALTRVRSVCFSVVLPLPWNERIRF